MRIEQGCPAIYSGWRGWGFNVTDEQFRMMKTLGLITEKEATSGELDGTIIRVTELGKIYADYWNELLQKINRKIMLLMNSAIQTLQHTAIREDHL